MAVTDQERLLLILEAQTRNFEREIKRAQSVADLEAEKIRRNFERSNRAVARGFNQLGRDMRTAIAALGVGLVVRDTVALADTWTTIGNRLAFAGIQSERLAQTQQAVADIASRTRSDLDATADLFARMFRSSQDLGASQERVLRVTEIVSKALAGAAQSERQGAIRQLGQGLGSGRLQGDELRSILENSRPIAEAIAREFDTTVGNLRKLGQEGVLESRRVFEAIERAGNDIDAAFGRTTFTVADAFTRLRTEAARFVGTNEQTSASVRGLTGLIDAVADNFDLLADAIIVVGTLLAGGFAGQAIGRALTALAALRISAASTGAALTAAFSFANILTVFGAAVAYVATQTDLLASSAERVARAEDSWYQALITIQGLEVVADGAADETGRIADEANRATDELNEMSGAADDAADSADQLAQNARDLAEAEKERAIATITAAIADREALVAQERRSQAFRRFASALNSGDDALRIANGQTPISELNDQAIAQSEEEIRRQEARIERLQQIVDSLEGDRLSPATSSENEDGSGGGNDPAGAARRRTLADLEEQANLTLARLQHRESEVRTIEDAAAVEQRTTAYIEAGLSATLARASAEAEVRAERAAMNAEAQRSYELQVLQDRADIARVQNNVALADQLSDQLEIARRTREIVDQLGVSEAEAAKRASEYVDARREAINIEREHNLDRRALEDQIEAARLRGDSRTERALDRRLELEERILELRREGVGEEAAIARAEAEIAALEQADMQGHFRAWFTGGVTAALEGDLGEFFQSWLQERAAAGLENALNEVADVLFDSFKGVLSQVIQSGENGLGQAVAAVFAGGATGGLNQLGEGSAKAADALGTVLTAAAADAATKTALTGAAAAASASQQTAATGSVVVASATLAKSLLAAATAASTFAVAGKASGGSDFASIVLKSLSFGGGKASGGGVRPGNWYMVGENGPEPFVPTAPGVVIPNGALEGLKLLGELPRFTPPPAPPSVNVNVVNQSGVNVDASVRPSADGVGFDVLLTRQTENALRSGRHDGALRDRWGVKPPRTRRS